MFFWIVPASIFSAYAIDWALRYVVRKGVAQAKASDYIVFFLILLSLIWFLEMRWAAVLATVLVAILFLNYLGKEHRGWREVLDYPIVIAILALVPMTLSVWGRESFEDLRREDPFPPDSVVKVLN